MTQLYLWLAGLVIGGGGIAGILATWMHSQKKAGQKQAEAEISQREAENAKAAGAVVAEHVDRADVVQRLRNHEF